MHFLKTAKKSLLGLAATLIIGACGNKILGIVFMTWLVGNHHDVRKIDPQSGVSCHAAMSYTGALKTECRSWDTDATPTDLDLATALASRSGMTYSVADQALKAFRDADQGNYAKLSDLGFTANDMNQIKVEKSLPSTRIKSLAWSFDILPAAMNEIIVDLAKTL